MSKLFPKFIIEDDCLVMMDVKYHSEIVNNKDKVAGGGWFRFDNSSRAYIFYGESQDFGRAKLEHIKKCVWDRKIFINPPQNRNLADRYKFYYDTGTEIIELEKSESPANIFMQSFLFRLVGKYFYKPGKLFKNAT